MAIGGGARGVNVHLAPADLVAATGAQVVDITVPDRPGAAAAKATRPAERAATRPERAPEG